MSFFLILQSTYTDYEIGLSLDGNLIDSFKDDKKNASRDLILSLEEVLKRNNVLLTDIKAIGVNQGPGPFTSLRVVITAANGLAFSTGVPLIGVISLQAMLEEYREHEILTVALLNAFNHDLYAGLYYNDELEIICNKSGALLENLYKRFEGKKIRFIGNGTLLAKNEIERIFGLLAHFDDPMSLESTLEQLAPLVYRSFINHDSIHNQLIPIYLKSAAYQSSEYK